MLQKKPHRIPQIAELIERNFAQIINREIELPPDTFVNITRVSISNDLQHAKIGLSIYPMKKRDEIFSLICKETRQLKHLLHQTLKLRKAPHIRLYLDRHAQKTSELNEALDRIKQQ